MAFEQLVAEAAMKKEKESKKKGKEKKDKGDKYGDKSWESAASAAANDAPNVPSREERNNDRLPGRAEESSRDPNSSSPRVSPVPRAMQSKPSRRVMMIPTLNW
ncbi:hypothetical protein VTK26DRAFT_4403 [Humicola hyalothermophila]